MKLRQNNRQPGKNPPHSRQKKVVNKPSKVSKEKYRANKGEFGKLEKNKLTKALIKQRQQGSLNELFHSVRVGGRGRKVDKQSNEDNRQSKVPSNNQFQESTASREFKLNRKKDYDDPNGQYFGSKISVKYAKKSRSKKRQKDKALVQMSKSLEVKIRTLRKIQKQQQSQSQSLKSQMSDQEMRRLKKMHSFEKMKLMNEIIGLEEKIIQKRHRL